MMNNEELVLSAVGAILKEMKAENAADLDAIREKLGDHGLLPKVLISQAEAKKLQLKTYIDDAIHRNARIVESKGAPHFYMSSLSE